ncbi:hypothetical protein [uncultured Mediterranean phage uvDeep-CGR2-KM21-C368]|nr:hypothetical protein [uncultured Mediterranean phage uvDeep-CGR2-KM21-C368]
MLKFLSKWIVLRKHFDIINKKLQVAERKIESDNKIITTLQKAKNVYKNILLKMKFKDLDKPFVTIIDEKKKKNKKIYRINK